MFLKFFGKKEKKGSDTTVSEGGLIHGIDPELNYCPSCGDEYRADIEQCSGCNVSLISGQQKLEKVLAVEETFGQRSMDISPDDDLVTLRKGPAKDIKVLQKLLAKERIPAILATDEESCGKGCCGGPELFLQIKKDDVQLASEILTRDFIKSTALDSHDLSTAHAVYDVQAKETVCPACGCAFSPTVGACPECGLCFD